MTTPNTTYQAHGKLLLTGEYFVLDGAQALAVPTQQGQKLARREKLPSEELSWRSLTHHGRCWFSASWRRSNTGGIELISASDAQVAERFQQILRAIQATDSAGLNLLFGYAWDIQLDFPRDWGLGSSSTFISLLAEVTHTDPYTLLAASFGGSGYDLACAQARGAILYQRQNGQVQVEALNWSPAYADQLYFVHLGRKQNSREGIRLYRELGGAQVTLIDEVTNLTQAFLAAANGPAAARVAQEHEELIATALQLPRVQSLYFADFPGVVKSLGAWGGDFVLAFSEAGPVDTKTYFAQRKYPVVIPWTEMVYRG